MSSEITDEKATYSFRCSRVRGRSTTITVSYDDEQGIKLVTEDTVHADAPLTKPEALALAARLITFAGMDPS